MQWTTEHGDRPADGTPQPVMEASPPPDVWARLRANLWSSLRDGAWAGIKVAAITATALGMLVIGLMVLYRVVDPPSTLILAQRLSGTEIDQRWVPLDRISPELIVAVIASEDGQFCAHRGVDFRALEAEMQRAARIGEDARGASTISMQVVKNVFLLPTRSYLRKAAEVVLTLVLERIWSKRRILEVYLNIAEWGPGVFGAEAGARYHFRKPAARLTARDAALMAVSLPNPIEREAGRPGPGTQRLAGVIERRARAMGQRVAACVRPG
jgi:monofunctional biosynthetic peptidoglycan transglycosylase